MKKREDVQVLNMIMIENGLGQVLVLDKKKKEGWEGLTFPGGKVEPEESFLQSAIREAKEETGLDISKVSFCGFVHWLHEGKNFRQVGLLYRAESFEGDLQESEEGSLFWMDLEEFINVEPKSDSMNEILEVYRGTCSEVLVHIRENKKGDVFYN